MTRAIDRLRIQDTAARAVRRMLRDARGWGLPGALGAVLLGGAALLATSVVPQQRSAWHDDGQTLLLARRRVAQAMQAPTAAPDSVDPQQRFRAGFPSADERHRRITALLALATGLGLNSRRSDIRSDVGNDMGNGAGNSASNRASNGANAALGLTRVRVLMPLTGAYVDLRRYIDQALRDDPALSLDLLRIERSDADAAELRAELQWSLWMRAADANDTGARASAGNAR